jgi:uncharacterized membrane protein
MTPRVRRVVQAVLYEACAIAFVAPTLSWLFGRAPLDALGLALTLSAIALSWNYVFNLLFERWEARQVVKGRSWWRRLVHGAGFEGGLSCILVPVMALWLNISLWQALVANLGILLFFLCYTVAFTWCFDRVFGLPQAARAAAP